MTPGYSEWRPTVAPVVVPLYRFCWGNNSKRATMQGRVCRVVCRGMMNSAMIEFTDNGQREVVSRNAIRRNNAPVVGRERSERTHQQEVGAE